jgi:hypothetical protein
MVDHAHKEKCDGRGAGRIVSLDRGDWLYTVFDKVRLS